MMRNFTVLLVVVIASCTAVQGEFILDAYMHDAMYGGYDERMVSPSASERVVLPEVSAGFPILIE